jgi:hypothetical protein
MTTAVHEAAHAVVALRVDLPVNGLTLRPAAIPTSDDDAGEDSFDSMLGCLGLSLPADYSDEGYPVLARGRIVAFAVAAELVEAPDGVLDGDAVREAVRTAEAATRP